MKGGKWFWEKKDENPTVAPLLVKNPNNVETKPAVETDATQQEKKTWREYFLGKKQSTTIGGKRKSKRSKKSKKSKTRKSRK